MRNSQAWYDPHWHYEHEPETRAALDLIFSDYFSRNEPGAFAPIRDTLLTNGDHYMHLADLTSYCQAQDRLGELYANPDRMGAQGHPERREFGKVLERPHHSRICNGNLEGGTMSHTLEKQSVADGPAISPLAGKPAPKEMLIDVAQLQTRVFRAQAGR